MKRSSRAWRAIASCVTLAAAGVVAVVVNAPPAAAATANTLTATALSNMSLSGYQDITATRDAVENAGHPLTVVPMQTVVGGGYTTQAICHPTDVHSSTTPSGFCWNATDDTTGNWYPQGITGSGDATGSSDLYATCPTCSGHKIVAVSWHASSAYTEFGDNGLARVSFVDVTSSLANAFYRHVLLVEPDESSAGYHRILNHADGIAWYGDLLFLATGGDADDTAERSRVIRVFDLRHFWQMSSTSSGAVGCTASTCSAAYSLFALPEVGYYQFPDGNVCTPVTGNDPCFTSVSLDRSTTPNALVTTEYYEPGAGGRILRWPLNSTSHLLQTSADGLVHPVEGWSSPIYRMQGAVTYGSHVVIEGLCPDGEPAVSYMPGGTAAVSGGFTKSCLHKGTFDSGRSTIDLHYWTTSPGNSENLDYWPSSGQLLLVNEFKGSGGYPGDRLVLDWACTGLTCS